MFRVREKQIKSVLYSLKSIFKGTAVNSVNFTIPKVKSYKNATYLQVKSFALDGCNSIRINSFGKKKIDLPSSIKVKSDLSFFNSMRLLYKPVNVEEIPKNKLLKIISAFYKKTSIAFNSIQIEAVYIDVPINGSEKITFENGNLILDSDKKILKNEKSVVVIFKEKKTKKSKVAVLSV